MATMTIRNLDDELKTALRLRAAAHGQSMEEEVRTILRQALGQPPVGARLGSELAAYFTGVGADLPVPDRRAPRPTPDWSEPA